MMSHNSAAPDGPMTLPPMLMYIDGWACPAALGEPVAPDEPDAMDEAPEALPDAAFCLGAIARPASAVIAPCHTTMKSHIDQVVLDNMFWEASAAFRLESSDAVLFYARNDHLGLTIPYEYMGIDHAYEPDFLVRLKNRATAIVEVKGFEDYQTKAKHTAARRWIEAVNNWGQLGRWTFHVCRNPQLLDKEMAYLNHPES